MTSAPLTVAALYQFRPVADPQATSPVILSHRAGDESATLDMVRDFREHDDATPIVLMGYYNPIYARRGGVARFLEEAIARCAQALIVTLIDEPDLIGILTAQIFCNGARPVGRGVFHHDDFDPGIACRLFHNGSDAVVEILFDIIDG
mgnify:CR=1 FL=1